VYMVELITLAPVEFPEKNEAIIKKIGGLDNWYQVLEKEKFADSISENLSDINEAVNAKELDNEILIKAVTNTDNLRSSIEQQYQNALYKAYDVKDYRLKQKITPSQDNR